VGWLCPPTNSNKPGANKVNEVNEASKVSEANKIIIEDQNFCLKTTDSDCVSIKNIIYIFSLKAFKFKGMKSLHFKLWKKAFFYNNININPKKVEKIHKILLKLNKTMPY
jgi:hypothetical protein